jgi:hypothetical protein
MKRSKEGARDAAPALVPDTMPTDQESICVSEPLANVCRREGIPIRPAQPMTPRDKGQLERRFRTLREAMP